MTNYEKIILHFKELKSCSTNEVSSKSLFILETYVFLEKSEQKNFIKIIDKWLDQKSAHKPLLVCYFKLIKAFSLFYTEQYDSALPLLSKAQHLFTEQIDLNGAAVCILLQGSIYRTFGNIDFALKSMWTAHEQFKKTDRLQFFLLACNINLGGTYADLKNFEEAIPLFKTSLEIAEAAGKYYWIIYALHGLGKIYLLQNNLAEAKSCFENAMKAAEKFNNPVSYCNSLSEMGNYYFAIGDYTEAEQFHNHALTLREQHQFIGGAITSCIRLGEIYFKQSKTAEAIHVLEKGLQLAAQLKVKLKMYKIELLLSEIYESTNELQKSFDHYKLFHQLHDEVELEDTARKIKNVQLLFEAEQTMKENIIIKKQKEEIEKKNIELQNTIDELTKAKIGKKARAITLIIAIILFILDDFILHFALTLVPADSYFISLIVKMVIIFSLSPINKSIEKYLLKRIIKEKKSNTKTKQ